ncbi:MAG: invasion associated locus B family protein [Pseudomonadota bacterium]
MNRFRLILIFSALASLGAGLARAEDNKAPPPVSSQPEMTTASFGAWTLRCQRTQETAQKICEIDEAVAPQNAPQNQQGTIARIVIAHPIGADKAQLRITVAVPPVIFIPTAPSITAKQGEPGIALTWKQCFGGGCFADATMTPAEIRVWRAVEADTGRINFSATPTRNLAVQFSMRGFAQALEALDKVKS